jgi:rubrerythrin
MGLEGLGFNRLRFRDLSEQEVLALAISSEEDDARIYRNYAERLRADYQDSAAMFDEMAAEEDTHRQRLIELHRARFGEVIPLIRREHVAGYYARRPVWLVENLGLDRIRDEAAAMEQDAEAFYLKAAARTEDAATRKLLGDLARAEASHRASADRAAEAHLDADARETEDDRAHRQFVLTWVQPGLAGLMDGSVSTLAPIFATAFATQDTWTTFLVGLAASVGAGISMGFTEAASDDGELSGRGSPVKRGFASGIMTTLGGLGHALPYLIPDFWTATITAIIVVFVELWAIVWIQNRFMDTPFLRANLSSGAGRRAGLRGGRADRRRLRWAARGQADSICRMRARPAFSSTRSASVTPSSVAKNASSARPIEPLSRQQDDSGQVLVSRSKHSASGIPPSKRRKTLPTEISSGARRNLSPPFLPRTVVRKPSLPSWLITTARCASEAFTALARSCLRSTCPRLTAQAISTRIARLVFVVSRIPASVLARAPTWSIGARGTLTLINPPRRIPR